MATTPMQTTRGGVWLTIAAAITVVVFLVAWLLGWIRFTTDPRVREILSLQEEARQRFVTTGGPSTLADATAAVAAMGQIRQKMESLPEPLRREVEQQGGSVFRSAFRRRIDAYFALPPAQRQAELDRQIKQEELMQQAFAAAGAVSGLFGGGRDAGGGSGTAAPASATPGPLSRTEEDRNRWRKQMIDRTSPEQRARYVEYRNAMEKRREQLGMPPSGTR